MSDTTVDIPRLGQIGGTAPIVILGPNGSGKTQLAQRLAASNQVSAISAQRRTWVDDNLPVQEELQLRNNVLSLQNRWRDNAWQPTEEINFVLSTLIQEHTTLLTARNEVAVATGTRMDPVTDTKLIQLQSLWNRLFPTRKLDIGGFFPKVRRLDAAPDAEPYHLRQMSDGERTVLYMAARTLTSDQPIILVDEPELHMHSRLAVRFWDEIEKLRPDCRFIYVTHDLDFTMSRRDATILVVRHAGIVEQTSIVEDVPSSVATEILGAATLPFYAKRIIFYEGAPGRGFASDFLSAWFTDSDTFAIPAGGRDAVCAAVAGLRAVGVAGAEVAGLIDRDFDSVESLSAVPDGVTVLAVHEIESVLSVETVVRAVAEHLGKEPNELWASHLEGIRSTFRHQTLAGVIARRVRARTGDLLDGAFSGIQIVDDLKQTSEHHSVALAALKLPEKVSTMFDEETARVTGALAGGGTEMLACLPGKHVLSVLSRALGFADTSQLTGLVVRSLGWREMDSTDPIRSLGMKLEQALDLYLPQRTVLANSVSSQADS